MRVVNVAALMSWQADAIQGASQLLTSQVDEIEGLESEFTSVTDLSTAWKSPAGSAAEQRASSIAGSLRNVGGSILALAEDLHVWAQAVVDAQDTVNNMRNMINGQLGLPVELSNDGQFPPLPPMATVIDIQNGTTAGKIVPDTNAVFREVNGLGSTFTSSAQGHADAQAAIDQANLALSESFAALDQIDSMISRSVSEVSSNLAAVAVQPTSNSSVATFAQVGADPFGDLDNPAPPTLIHTVAPDLGVGDVNIAAAVAAGAGAVPLGRATSVLAKVAGVGEREAAQAAGTTAAKVAAGGAAAKSAPSPAVLGRLGGRSAASQSARQAAAELGAKTPRERLIASLERFRVKDKHLHTSSAKDSSQFAAGQDPKALITEGLNSRNARLLPDDLTRGGGERVLVVDMGRVIGTRGETKMRVIVANDRVTNAFPVRNQ